MCAVAVTERRAQVEQAQQSHLLFVDASIYVRQYFDECCLGVRRLQTGHHTVVVEVDTARSQLGNERQIGDVPVILSLVSVEPR